MPLRFCRAPEGRGEPDALRRLPHARLGRPGLDSSARENHARVSRINDLLKQREIETWFDEKRMEGNIVEQMCAGIDDSSTCVVFITANCSQKVGPEYGGQLQEGVALRRPRKTARLMIPVVMEEASGEHGTVRDPSSWDGSVGMSLGGQLYIDMSGDMYAPTFAAKVDELVVSIERAAEPGAKETPLTTGGYSGSPTSKVQPTCTAATSATKRGARHVAPPEPEVGSAVVEQPHLAKPTPVPVEQISMDLGAGLLGADSAYMYTKPKRHRGWKVGFSRVLVAVLVVVILAVAVYFTAGCGSSGATCGTYGLNSGCGLASAGTCQSVAPVRLPVPARVHRYPV